MKKQKDSNKDRSMGKQNKENELIGGALGQIVKDKVGSKPRLILETNSSPAEDNGLRNRDGNKTNHSRSKQSVSKTALDNNMKKNIKIDNQMQAKQDPKAVNLQ